MKARAAGWRCESLREDARRARMIGCRQGQKIPPREAIFSQLIPA